jgi:hypothetical protein
MDVERAARFEAALSVPLPQTNTEKTVKNASKREELRGFHSETPRALGTSPIYKFCRTFYSKSRIKHKGEKQNRRKEERV